MKIEKKTVRTLSGLSAKYLLKFSVQNNHFNKHTQISEQNE